MNLKLETERLILRPFRNEDARRTRDLANNKELADMIGLPHPYELKYAEDWIAIQPDQIKNGVAYPLAIEAKELSDIIGTITLRIDKNHHKGELGYWIGRDYWGNGFATEAVRRLIDFGFNELNLNKIWAAALSKNKASSAVLEKAGLQKEGTLRQDRFMQGNYEDVEIYGLLRSDMELKG